MSYAWFAGWVPIVCRRATCQTSAALDWFCRVCGFMMPLRISVCALVVLYPARDPLIDIQIGNGI